MSNLLKIKDNDGNGLRFEDIPSSIQLAWHGLNDRLNLDFFLKSPIPWGEIDLRQNANGELTLRHDPFDTHPLRDREVLLSFKECLTDIQQHGKCLKIDLKEGAKTMVKMVEVLKKSQFDESRLWITTNLKDVSLDDYGGLKKTFPRAILQSTIPHRFMFRDMTEEDRVAWLSLNQGLGVTRLSISWYDLPSEEEVKKLKGHGFEVNLYHVDSLTDFHGAISLRPEAITSDFHLPEWGFYGRGSGENGFYLE